MKYYLKIALSLIAVCTFGACAETGTHYTSTTYHKTSQYKNHVKARVTYYYKHEDKYGSKIAIGGHAHEGITVAVRRKLAELGHWGFVPAFVGKIGDGNVRVEDRGRDVERLKASHGKAEVMDTYLECKNRRTFNQRVAGFEHDFGQYVDLFF